MHEGHRQRLKQTYMQNGAEAFHEHQLLELLLTYSIPRRDTNELAHSLIEKYGSLSNVLSANVYDLMQTDGVGEHTAVLLSLVDAISSIEKEQPSESRLVNPYEAERFCKGLFRDMKHEAMFVISLDKYKRVLHADKISSGTVNETVVYPRLVVECALRHGASGVMLSHNHPSGDLRPSKNDIETTENILVALEKIGIGLNDHIIISDTGAFSMMRGSITYFDKVALQKDENELLAAERNDIR